MNALNKFFVNAYKATGFVVLTTILAGVLSYVGMHAFYFVNDQWLMPTVVAPTDDRVVQLYTQLAQQQAQREKLVAERADLQVRLKIAERIVGVEQGFQHKFKNAVRSDLSAREDELDKLYELSSEHARVKDEIAKSRAAYTNQSREELQALLDARLIKKEAVVNTHYALSQIANANLALVEKEKDIENRKAQLEREINALSTASAPRSGRRPAGDRNYSSLRMEEDYTRSTLELAKAKESQAFLAQSIEGLSGSIEKFDTILKALRESPYIKAMEERVAVAFVPYENVENTKPGAPLYGCRVGLIFCSRVGTVTAQLEGEVVQKHPLYNQMERGQMVQIDLKDKKWGERKVLYTRRPLLVL